MHKFLSDKFNSLEKNKIYKGEELLDIYFDAEEEYMAKYAQWYNTFEWQIGDTKWYKDDNKKRNQDSEHISHLMFRPPYLIERKDFGSFYYQRKPEVYSLEDKEPMLRSSGGNIIVKHLSKTFHYSTTIINEIRNKSHGKRIIPDDDYIFITIPHEIIDEHLTSISIFYPSSKWTISSKHNTDYSIQKQFVREVESHEEPWKPSNWIPILDEYDKKYPEVYFHGRRLQELGEFKGVPFEKLPTTMKWRHKLFISQYISTRYLGILYPNIHETYRDYGQLATENPTIFGSGSHRLLTITLSQMDIPSILHMKSFLHSHKHIAFSLMPYFGGDYLIVCLNINTHLMKIYKHSNPTMSYQNMTQIYEGIHE
tara:strand:+ start:16952 stop:18055 length:1104 start_codon:yes stop_codon:yes gene_type:complete